MADVITRFKLETTQYDSALRDASKQMASLTQHLQIAGKEFDKFAQKHVEEARSLGQVASGATNLKDKLKDLVGAYNDVAKAYNSLTKEQQQTDFGKAMAQSLQELQGRIKETKQDISAMNQSSDGLKGVLDGVAQKFGLNIGQLTKFGGALAAAGAAIKVSTDAFVSMESNVDEWGRTVEATQSVYETFLQSLNNSDFSGFISRINEVIQKARDAYDAMDELNTRGGIVSTERIKLQARQTELKAIIRREGKDSAEGKKAQEDLLALEPKLRESFKTEAKLNYNAFKAEVDRKLLTAGIKPDKATYDFLMRSFSSDETYKRLRDNARGAVSTQYQYSEITGDVVGSKVVDTRNLNQKLLDLFTDEWRDKFRPYLNAMYSARGAAASSLLGDARYIKPGSGGGSGSGRQLTDPEKAQEKFAQAQKDYAQAIEQASLELKAGTVTQAEAKKKELAAEENLWKSIGDAREIYDDPKFKEAQENVAAKVVELGGSVNTLLEEQKKAQETAREMAAAQKKVAAALEEASTAYSANDLKGYMSALRKVGGDYTQGMQKGNFSYTSSNLSAFTAYLNERLAQADLGTTLYQNLTKQLADANMLANLMETAVKNGIDIAQFDPQALFNMIFGENPGDYIDDAKWQEVRKKIEELLGKPITIDVNTGEVNVNGKNGGKTTSSQNQLGLLVNNVQNITRSLEHLGVEIPEGFQKVISTMQIITSVMNTIQSLAGVGGALGGMGKGGGGIFGMIGSIFDGIFGFQNGGVVHAANGFSGVVPGNYYSGDNIPALLNSGETVLTKAQSGIVSTALQMTGAGYAVSETRIESDQIRIVLKNGAQAKGMTVGQYLEL